MGNRQSFLGLPLLSPQSTLTARSGLPPTGMVTPPTAQGQEEQRWCPGTLEKTFLSEGLGGEGFSYWRESHPLQTL